MQALSLLRFTDLPEVLPISARFCRRVKIALPFAHLAAQTHHPRAPRSSRTSLSRAIARRLVPIAIERREAHFICGEIFAFSWTRKLDMGDAAFDRHVEEWDLCSAKVNPSSRGLLFKAIFVV